MAPTRPTVTDDHQVLALEGRMHAISERAGQFCHQIERGQASRPFADALSSLRSTQTEPLRMSMILPASIEADAVHQWLIAAGGSVDENDRQSAGGWRDSLCKDTPLLVSDVQLLRESMSTYQQFCRGSILIVMSGSDSDSDWEPEELSFLATLLPLFQLVRLVTSDPEGTPPTWWAHTSSQVSEELPPVWHERQANSPIALPQSLRNALAIQEHALRLGIVLGALATCCERGLRRVRGSVAAEPCGRAATVVRSPADAELAGQRDQMLDALGSLELQVTLASERATQPLGRLSALMRETVGALELEDLEREIHPTTVRLTVHAEHLAKINRRVEQVLRDDLAADVTLVQRRVSELAMRCGVAPPLVSGIKPLTAERIWYTVENLLSIGKTSHIELTRRGIFDVLTAGRQKVFVIIMFLSLAGRMGLPELFRSPGSSVGFGLFMAAVMLGSMINAVLTWRRENREQSAKELEKIRETLIADGGKVIDQIEKVKLTAVKEYLKEVGRQFEAVFKRSAEQTSARQKAEAEAAAQKRETLRKLLDAQTKLFTEGRKQVAQWQAELNSVRISGRTMLQQSLETVIAKANIAGAERASAHPARSRASRAAAGSLGAPSAGGARAEEMIAEAAAVSANRPLRADTSATTGGKGAAGIERRPAAARISGLAERRAARARG